MHLLSIQYKVKSTHVIVGLITRIGTIINLKYYKLNPNL